MRLEGPNWSCNVAAARLVEIASGLASDWKDPFGATITIHCVVVFFLQSKSCCQGIPFRWTCFPANCAILASGQKETARLEVLDCAQVTMAHAGRATPCDRDPQEEEEASPEVFGLREWHTCACCLRVCFSVFAFALLWCFDLIAQIWAWAGRKAAHQTEIANDLLLGWWIVVAVRMVSVGIVIPESR